MEDRAEIANIRSEMFTRTGRRTFFYQFQTLKKTRGTLLSAMFPSQTLVFVSRIHFMLQKTRFLCVAKIIHEKVIKTVKNRQKIEVKKNDSQDCGRKSELNF